MIYEIAQSHHLAIGSFNLYPSAASRTRWEALGVHLKQELVTNGEQYLDFEYPMLPATKYMEFCRNGNREPYQQLFYARRWALIALTLAECAEYSGRFVDDIINGIFAICEESGWQAPAHNYYQGSGFLCLVDVCQPILDLYSCETAAVLSIVLYLLEEKLDEVTPQVKKRIQSELDRRIVIPYLTGHFAWMGMPGQKVNNWTPWCTQNTLLAVMLRGDLEDGLKRQVMMKAAESLDVFLDSYGEDGCCNEGAWYYRHAGLCLFSSLEVLNNVTNDAFAPLYRNSKIRNIAPYIMHVHIHGNYYANFSDCSPLGSRVGAREFLYAERICDKVFRQFVISEYQDTCGLNIARDVDLYQWLQSIFTDSEIRSQKVDTMVQKPDNYYPSAGLFTARDDTIFVAVKAGNNDDSHNHNDVGSVIVYKNNVPLLIDVGVGVYTKKTFSPQRYDIWTMQSAYHNLPTFGEQQQMPGEQYAAEDVTVSLEAESALIRMELCGAYPAGTVDSYIREVRLIKGCQLYITDKCKKMPSNTFLSLMTKFKPTVCDGGILLENGEKIRISGAKDIVVEEIILDDEKLKNEWGNALYRTKIYNTVLLSLAISC